MPKRIPFHLDDQGRIKAAETPQRGDTLVGEDGKEYEVQSFGPASPVVELAGYPNDTERALK